MMIEIEEPHFGASWIDHWRQKPVDADKSADVDAFDQLIQELQRRLSLKSFVSLGLNMCCLFLALNIGRHIIWTVILTLKLILQLSEPRKMGFGCIWHMWAKSKSTNTPLRLLESRCITGWVIQQIVIVNELVPLIVDTVGAFVDEVTCKFWDLWDSRVGRLPIATLLDCLKSTDAGTTAAVWMSRLLLVRLLRLMSLGGLSSVALNLLSVGSLRGGQIVDMHFWFLNLLLVWILRSL